METHRLVTEVLLGSDQVWALTHEADHMLTPAARRAECLAELRKIASQRRVGASTEAQSYSWGKPS